MSNPSNYVILEIDGEEVYIEVADNPRPNRPVYQENTLSEPPDYREEDQPTRVDEKQLNQLAKTGGKLFEVFKEFRSDEMEISFSIKANAETGFLCFAKTQVEGQFGVKLTWKNRNKKGTEESV